MGRQPKVLPNLRAGDIQHGGLYGSHRGLTGAPVEDRGGASPYDGRTWLGKLMNGDPADAFGGVLHDGSDESDRGRCAGQWHADDLCGNSGAGEVDEILRGELRPVQGWRRADIEDCARTSPESIA